MSTLIVPQQTFEDSAEKQRSSRFNTRVKETGDLFVTASTLSPIIFNNDDETEAGRGLTYAFDPALEQFVEQGGKITTAYLVSHLKRLGCQNPESRVREPSKSRLKIQPSEYQSSTALILEKIHAASQADGCVFATTKSAASHRRSR